MAGLISPPLRNYIAIRYRKRPHPTKILLMQLIAFSSPRLTKPEQVLRCRLATKNYEETKILKEATKFVGHR